MIALWFLLNLSVTVWIETIVVSFCHGSKQLIFPVIAINLVSLPLAYILYGAGWQYFAVELIVVTLESILFNVLANIPPTKAVVLSLLANFASMLPGIL